MNWHNKRLDHMALHGNIAVMKRLMTMYSDSLTL